jgi:hypothetical protein
MKLSHFALSFIMLPLLASCASSSEKAEKETVVPKTFDVVLPADSYWNGKIFPPAGSCTTFGGLAKTPTFVVKKAPEGTNVILIEFNNLSVKGLDKDGGLGTIGYVYKAPADGSEVVLRSVPGGKVNLPRPAFLEKNHKVEGALPAAYFAPCLKRELDQEISATVKAVKRTGNVYKQHTEVLDEVVIPLGTLKD